MDSFVMAYLFEIRLSFCDRKNVLSPFWNYFIFNIENCDKPKEKKNYILNGISNHRPASIKFLIKPLLDCLCRINLKTWGQILKKKKNFAFIRIIDDFYRTFKIYAA